MTFRLDGSLPATRGTDLWTRDGPKFVELDQLLDAVSTGPRWLARRDVAAVVASALWEGVRETKYELGAWVLMPNHVHVALRPLGDQDLASTVKSIKGGSARAANRLLNRSGSRFWARDYFDRRIRDRDHEGRVTRYIENNPVKAGLCNSEEEWLWSSSRKNAD